MNQTLFGFSVGSIGAVLSYLVGGWSELLGFFLFLIVVDYITGIIAAVYEAKTNKGEGLSSSVGFKGLAKKFFMVLAIVIAHRLDIIMDTNVLMSGALWGYIALELISIVENYARIGLPLPKRVMEVIAVIKQKGDGQ